MNTGEEESMTCFDKRCSSRFVFLAIIPLFVTSCKKNEVVAPPAPKDPRTYTWTIDTLAYPGSLQTIMTDIWGSAPNDVCIAGHNDGGPAKIYHFDGNSWSPVDMPRPTGILDGIYGFAPNDIWAVGDKTTPNPNPPPNFLPTSLAYRYNGTSWSHVTTPPFKSLTAIWGRAPNDIWMGSFDGQLLHYNGTSFVQDSLPFLRRDTSYNTYSVITSLTGNSSGEVFALLNLPNITGSYIYRRSNGKWIAIDSTFGFDRQGLWTSPTGYMYTYGSGILKSSGGTSRQLFDQIFFCSALHGTSDENIFATIYTASSGAIYQFNGRDWYEYPTVQLAGVSCHSIWVIEESIFVVASTVIQGRNVTLVFHGK